MVIRTEKIHLNDMDILNHSIETFSSIVDASLTPLFERLKSAKIVLLGEATHGTAEFYQMRAEITRALIEHHGFNIVAVEADPRNPEAHDLLTPQRLERAIGVVYRPETEMQSHYFYASLPKQFDEYIWFDESSAVSPLTRKRAGVEEAETFPFGV